MIPAMSLATPISAKVDGPSGRVARPSVIVPVGPGDQSWRALADDLSGCDLAEVVFAAADPMPTNFPSRVETADATVTWTAGPIGRGRQLNAGAATADGDLLLFVHADSRIGPAAVDAIAARVDAEPDTLHFLRLRFAADGPASVGWNERGARFRSERLGLPFGDQCFGMSRALFERLGRFDETCRYGEDHLLVWAAHRAGIPVRVVDAPAAEVVTSARRYRDSGWLRTTAKHVALTVAQAAPQLAMLARDRLTGRRP
ncbi:MAG: glycosyl transferase family 2 [Planctomycetota bacterium]